MAKTIYGSIDLSKAGKAKMIKQVTLRNGEKHLFLQLAVVEKKEPKTFVDETTGKSRTYTHFVTCAPTKDKQVEGVDYYIGDLQTYEPQPVNEQPTPEQVEAAPAIAFDEDSTELPF